MSLPKTVCRRSSTRTRLQSCATPTMPINRENIGSTCTRTPSGTAITLTRTDCIRNTSSSRTLLTNIAPNGCPTIVLCLPFAVNIVSLSCCFVVVTFRCMHLLAYSRPIWWRTIVACLTGSVIRIKNDENDVWFISIFLSPPHLTLFAEPSHPKRTGWAHPSTYHTPACVYSLINAGDDIDDSSLSPPQPALFAAIVIIPISTPTRTVRRHLHLPYLHPTSYCSPRFGVCRFFQHFSSKSISFNILLT